MMDGAVTCRAVATEFNVSVRDVNYCNIRVLIGVWCEARQMSSCVSVFVLILLEITGVLYLSATIDPIIPFFVFAKDCSHSIDLT